MSINRRTFVRDALAIGTVGAVCGAYSGIGRAAAAPGAPLIVDGLDPSDLTPEYLDLLHTGGVHCWHQSVGDDFASFAALLDFCDQHKTQIAPVGSVREIRELHRQGIISHVSGWQSADALIVAGDPALHNLRAYRELGLRVCGISYNIANQFGGGCLEPEIGLTRAGHRLVEQIHRERILLDVGGHTNERTSFAALAMSEGIPVICSHTNVRALNDNPRCTTDQLFEAIAKTGGVIGLTAFSDFHVRKSTDAQVARTAQAGLDRHLDQYDYLKRLVGVEHIGLGPDFLEGRNTGGRVGADESNVMAPEAYSQELPWFYIKGFETIGELPNVTQGLLKRGWSTVEVNKMLGENWLRVYEKSWGA